MSVSESEILRRQTNAQFIDFERIYKSVRQNQVIGNEIDDQIMRAVSSAVTTVEKRMHDAILTAINNLLIPRAEMAPKSITGSAGHGPGFEIHIQLSHVISPQNHFIPLIPHYDIGVGVLCRFLEYPIWYWQLWNIFRKTIRLIF